jgi:hypothetical protein
VRRRRVAPVDDLAGSAAVPRLGLAGVHAAAAGRRAVRPAAQLASLWASEAHARLDRVEIAQQGLSFGYERSISITLSLGHRKHSQISGRRLPLVTLNPFAPTVKSAEAHLARSVPALCCRATELECQLEVYGHTLLTKRVAGKNETLRRTVPPLGFRQLRSKRLAGRHTSTVDGGGERPKLS